MPKKVGSRFRSVTQKRKQGRFRVALGYQQWIRLEIYKNYIGSKPFIFDPKLIINLYMIYIYL